MSSKPILQVESCKPQEQNCSLRESLSDIEVICEINNGKAQIPVIDLDDSSSDGEEDSRSENTISCDSGEIQFHYSQVSSNSSLELQMNSANNATLTAISHTNSEPPSKTEEPYLTNEKLVPIEKCEGEENTVVESLVRPILSFQSNDKKIDYGGSKRKLETDSDVASKVIILSSPELTTKESTKVVHFDSGQQKESNSLTSKAVQELKTLCLQNSCNAPSSSSREEAASAGTTSTSPNDAKKNSYQTVSDILDNLYKRVITACESNVDIVQNESNERGTSQTIEIPRGNGSESVSVVGINSTKHVTEKTALLDSGVKSATKKQETKGCRSTSASNNGSSISSGEKSVVFKVKSPPQTLEDSEWSEEYGHIIVYDSIGVPCPLLPSQKDCIVPMAKKTTALPIASTPSPQFKMVNDIVVNKKKELPKSNVKEKSSGEMKDGGKMSETNEDLIILFESQHMEPKSVNQSVQTVNDSVKPLATTCNSEQTSSKNLLQALNNTGQKPQQSMKLASEVVGTIQRINELAFLGGYRDYVRNVRVHPFLPSIYTAASSQLYSTAPMPVKESPPLQMPVSSAVQGSLQTTNALLPLPYLSKLRPIAIDGSNVAFRRGHTTIKAFVPQFRRRYSPYIKDGHLLEELSNKQQLVVFTPSREINGERILCNDDRFLLDYAVQTGAVVVSNDNFREYMNENASWRETIFKRLLMYTFADDLFMVPDDPLGRSGPSLERFLSF